MAFWISVSACGVPASVADAGLGDAGAPDAGDAGAVDSGSADAGLPDAGPADGGAFDAGAADAGTADAGVADAGFVDAGFVDAGGGDAGIDGGGATDAGTCGFCAAYSTSIQNAGTVATAALTEISGVAASRVHANVIYAENDSGGLPSIYVLSRTGASLGELQLNGAVNLDWEDLAVGPCPAGSCVYVGDLGDNGSNRSTPYYVYRVDEPAVPPMATVGVTAERFELQYPGGAHFDCETLMVHPVTGDLYVVTKRQFGQKSSAYKATAPLSATGPNVMTLVANLAVPDGLDLPITAGDIDPCGRAVLLRSYNALYEFRLGAGAFDTVFTAPFTRVPSAPQSLNASGELQGEAVCWLPGGGYLSVSEGMSATLHVVACQ